MKAKKGKALILALQAVALFVLAALSAILRPVAGLYWLLKWLILPLAGAFTAYLATRKGVNPYVAWIFPPLMATLAGTLISLGYAPEGGGIVVCALISILGAATGDVINRSSHRAAKGRKHGS